MAAKQFTHDIKDWAWWSAKVKLIAGERRRFFAPSRSGGEDYLVDLEANQFKGQCGCRDHITRKRRCWHIRLCMWVWYQNKIREEARQDNPGGQEHEGP